MIMRRAELPPLDELSPVLEELTFTGYSRTSLSLARRIYRRCLATIAEIVESSTPKQQSDDHVHLYSFFAGDFASRDALRQIHMMLSEYAAWLNQHEKRLGKPLHRICLAGLRRLSARAIASSTWSYGIAFKMTQMVYRTQSDCDQVALANELVVTLANKVKLGPSWYDPRREQHAGGWITTWCHCLAQVQVRPERIQCRPLTEDPEADDQSPLAKLIQSEQSDVAAKAALLLAQLPQDERFVVEELYWNNQSLRQIADVLGVSAATVLRKRNRAISRLALLLGIPAPLRDQTD